MPEQFWETKILGKMRLRQDVVLSSGAEGAPDARYERRRLYAMDGGWGGAAFDASQSLILAAPFGGPIAVLAKQNAVLQASDHRGAPRREIAVFRASGKPMCVWSYARWGGARFVTAGWTAREEFLVLLGNGVLLIFSLFRDEPAVHATLAASSDADIEDGIVWRGGLLLVNAVQGGDSAQRVLEVAVAMDVQSEQRSPGLRLLTRVTMARSEAITCAAVVNADVREDAQTSRWHLLRPAVKDVELMISTTARTVYVARKGRAATRHDLCDLIPSPIVAMATRPLGDFIACLTDQPAALLVLAADFSNCLVRVDFGMQPAPGAAPMRAKRPDQMVWCGTDCILCCWNSAKQKNSSGGESAAAGAAAAASGRAAESPAPAPLPGRERFASKLLLVGPTGTTRALDFDSEGTNAGDGGWLVLCQELDHARLITERSAETLRIVPPLLLAMRSLEASAPAAMLLDGCVCVCVCVCRLRSRVCSSRRALVPRAPQVFAWRSRCTRAASARRSAAASARSVRASLTSPSFGFAAVFMFSLSLQLRTPQRRGRPRGAVGQCAEPRVGERRQFARGGRRAVRRGGDADERAARASAPPPRRRVRKAGASRRKVARRVSASRARCPHPFPAPSSPPPPHAPSFEPPLDSRPAPFCGARS
jgi:hypothetical protein